MRSWFDALEDREKILVLATAVFVAVTAFWFGVWKPIDNGQEAAAIRVDTWRLSLRELQPLKGQIQASASGQPNQAGQAQPLVVIVDGTLRQRGLYNALQRSQPTPSGDGIRVEFESAPFDDMMLWLGDINRQYGLLVQSGSFSVASGENPGRVNSTLTLER
jgi:type II secretory pathway component PulM